MPFVVGDNVKTKDEPITNYRVVAVDESGALTVKDAYGNTTTKAQADVEASTGMSANFAAYGPDLIEILTNVVVFGGQNLILRKGFLKL